MFKLDKIKKNEVVKEYLEKHIKYNDLPEETKKLFLDVYHFGFSDGMYHAQDHVGSLFDSLQKVIPN